MRGTTPPVIRSVNSKPELRGMRLDLQDHVAELAVPARLLLVAAALGDRLADGFAIADARAPPLDRDAEAIGEPLGRDAQVHLALAPQHDFVRLGIVDHRDRGVLVDQLGERLAELDVVLALLGRDRDGEHRRDGLHLGDRLVRRLAGRERVAGLCPVELAERDRVARRGGGPLLMRGAHELEHAGDPARLVGRRMQRRAVGKLAGEHARDRQLAAMRVWKRLEH